MFALFGIFVEIGDTSKSTVVFHRKTALDPYTYYEYYYKYYKYYKVLQSTTRSVRIFIGLS